MDCTNFLSDWRASKELTAKKPLARVSSFAKSQNTSTEVDSVRTIISSLEGVSQLGEFNPEFLKSDEFMSLNDFGITLAPPQGIGRDNPFNKIGDDIVNSNTTKTMSTSIDIPTKENIDTKPSASSRIDTPSIVTTPTKPSPNTPTNQAKENFKP